MIDLMGLQFLFCVLGTIPDPGSLSDLQGELGCWCGAGAQYMGEDSEEGLSTWRSQYVERSAIEGQYMNGLLHGGVSI